MTSWTISGNGVVYRADTIAAAPPIPLGGGHADYFHQAEEVNNLRIVMVKETSPQAQAEVGTWNLEGCAGEDLGAAPAIRQVYSGERGEYHFAS